MELYRRILLHMRRVHGCDVVKRVSSSKSGVDKSLKAKLCRTVHKMPVPLPA